MAKTKKIEIELTPEEHSRWVRIKDEMGSSTTNKDLLIGLLEIVKDRQIELEERIREKRYKNKN